MPTPSERGTNDKGTCFPKALPLETEVILTTWAEPNKEARSEPLGVGNEFLPCGNMVSLECGGASGLFGVEVSRPELDDDDVWGGGTPQVGYGGTAWWLEVDRGGC